MDTLHVGSITSRGEVKNLKTGVITKYAPSYIQTSIPLTYGKLSNNTGGFTPGVYRRNPYKIYREFYSGPEELVTVQLDGTTQYTATLEGDIAAYFANRSRALVDSIGTITSNCSNFAERALVRAYGKVGSDVVGLGENLGELRETIGLLRHPFKGLRDFLFSNNLRNLGLLNRVIHYQKSGTWVEHGGRSLSRADAGKAAAGAWLELRYGLLPLIYTVQDLMKLVNQKVLALDPNKIRCSVGNVKERFDKRYTPYYVSLGMTGITATPCLVDEMQFHASVHYKLSKLPSTADLLGLTPKYLPELGYELTYLSFVLDWWFDVGSWLSCLRFQPEVTILGNTVSTKVSRNVSAEALRNFIGVTKSRVNTKDVGTYHCEYFERVVDLHLPTFPLLKLEFASYVHLVDALALTLQFILGKIKR